VHPWETAAREPFLLNRVGAEPDAPDQSRSYFLYSLIRPRRDFPADATDAESATMRAHAQYWRPLVEQGTVLVFGPVNGLGDVGGIAVIAADTEDTVKALGMNDPAVTSGLTTFRICAMPRAIAAPGLGNRTG
jgi:uncharacterized protein YciI